MNATAAAGSAAVHGRFWGARAADWAEFQEPYNAPLFEAAFAKCRVGQQTRLLDIGCGAGLAVQMAAERSAIVAGLDASEEMIEIARRRTPSADFRVGDIEELPWPGASFDVVTSFNSLEFADSRIVALREAARVTRPRGCVVVAAWGEPERCQAAVYIAALRSMLPPPPPDAPRPWSMSEAMALRNVIEAAGLRMTAMREVTCSWLYRDDDYAARALMAGELAARAIELAGEPAVRETVLESVAPFRRRDGSYRIDNVFRLAVVEI